MEVIVRTALGAQLQTCQLLKLPLPSEQYRSLNEKLNTNKDIHITVNDVPSVKYVAIGNGGHKMVVGANGLAKPEPIQHTPQNAALYNQLPFVLRLPSNDLTPSERSQFRLRKLETHDGIQYVAYYLKVLDLSMTTTKLELRSVKNGVTVSTPYVYSLDNLNPTPPTITNTGVITTTGDYIACTAKVPFEMTAADIAEFLNVCNIIYGDDGYAMISEIAVCSGVDKTDVVGIFNGTSAAYTDAIDVWVINFISTFFAAKFANDSISLNLEVGSVESLLVTP
jgi:hypothetical protein